MLRQQVEVVGSGALGRPATYRHFRLIWEALHVITGCIGLLLLSWQKAPSESILAQNAEILRKTSERGAKYCGLNDVCVIFTVSMPIVIGAVCSRWRGGCDQILHPEEDESKDEGRRRAISSNFVGGANVTQKVAVSDSNNKKQAAYEANSTQNDHLTSFERNCIGAPFHKLFWDCDDVAYVMYKGRRCSTGEALLLTGYLYYGDHIYQASSVMLLLTTIPKVLRTSNVLILRWYVDPKEGTLSQALTCTWFHACEKTINGLELHQYVKRNESSNH